MIEDRELLSEIRRLTTDVDEQLENCTVSDNAGARQFQSRIKIVFEQMGESFPIERAEFRLIPFVPLVTKRRGFGSPPRPFDFTCFEDSLRQIRDILERLKRKLGERLVSFNE